MVWLRRGARFVVAVVGVLAVVPAVAAMAERGRTERGTEPEIVSSPLARWLTAVPKFELG